MSRVSVIVSSYQSEATLGEALASLGAQSLAPQDVIVVDAGSSDGSVAVAESGGARVLAVPNLGLGHAYNRGAELASGDTIFFMNGDVALDAACLARLADALAADETTFAADPTQLDWDGAELIHGRTVLRRGRLLASPIPGLALDPRATADGDVAPTVTANAGAMLARRAQFVELGGFDERFFMDFEDLDLCWRAWQRGWRSVYVPGAVVRHRVGTSTAAAPEQAPRRLRSSHRNLVRFALKNLPPGAALRVVAGEIVRSARRPSIVGSALASVAGDLPAVLRERRRLGPKRSVYEALVAL